MSCRFDAIIVGAGQAGPPLAGRLTGAGQSVALIERKLFGGTCVNTGCMPTKTLVASARAAHMARRAADFGVVLKGEVGVDMARVKSRADTVIANARDNVRSWLEGMRGCTVIEGHARFEDAQTLRVGEERLTAPRIFLDVGARAAVPDMPGVHDIPYLTNTSILELDRVPPYLLIVGGSYIGLEYAQMYRRFGARVTVVEKGPYLIGREDEDVSTAVRGILEGEGIDVRTGVAELAFERAGDGIRVTADGERIDCSHVLLAVGRTPNTDDLGLEQAGVTTDKRGYISVDDDLHTNVAGIWALGDCNGRGAFTHTSYNDFEIVAANLLDGEHRRLSERVSGYALYIDPPLGRVGIGEAAARKRGRRFLVGKRPMGRVGRAVERDETLGFMKIIIDSETKAILGAAILGIEGDEAIHGIIDMMTVGATATQLQRTVPIHPNVSELIPTLIAEARAPGS
ncbi:mercuric reductase [Rhodanobacter thiooxydans]|uniref:Mercuric reductase n=1 Tax=Rhodanobacter thiooxydans TaxID=416169 RepID=A0A154QLA0_9GAMM|nr:FAD-containing oxidoreductase [Rhodanobacter thiooxydans]EIL98178.1 mercuric reductase [Rhodanobacter thiooxydans LCS2]KZC24930.1 mercuric reductase [Rhodanobacter thiooxydans]